MNESSRTLPPEYYTCLQELQAIDYVLVELTLYLDTHPNDPQALAQYDLFQKGKIPIRERFESQFGPLRHYGDSPIGSAWEWSATPWPWQV